MSEPTAFPDLKLARQEAAQWLARMDRGLDADEARELGLWRASPANARALRELTSMWQDMDQMTVLADMFPRQHSMAAATAVAGRRRWPMALAASLLLVACAAVLVLETRLWRAPLMAQSISVKPVRYATAVGEQRVVTLADGSTLALNTDTVVDVSLQKNQRDLSLLRGEAHFTVAHDKARPFLVAAGNRMLRAVGTAFAVRLRPSNAMDVLVTEGIVGLDRTDVSAQATPGKPDPTQLSAGQLLQIDRQGLMRVQALDGNAQAAWLAWRGGMLVFEGQTLESALDEFSRYTTDRFSIPDPQLRRLRIGGYFPVGDTSALLSALDSGFGLTAQRGADGSFVITRATAGRAGSH